MLFSNVEDLLLAVWSTVTAARAPVPGVTCTKSWNPCAYVSILYHLLEGQKAKWEREIDKSQYDTLIQRIHVTNLVPDCASTGAWQWKQCVHPAFTHTCTNNHYQTTTHNPHLYAIHTSGGTTHRPWTQTLSRAQEWLGSLCERQLTMASTSGERTTWKFTYVLNMFFRFLQVICW